MSGLTAKHFSHKVGVNVHHLEWCTKYRYCMMRDDKYKNACEVAIRKQADRHKIFIREVFVMPDHVHMSVELPLHMSSSKALQLLKGGSSYLLFRFQPKFRLRYPKKHFWSPGGYAASVGYTTVDVVDAYVRNQRDIHQKSLTEFVGSPAL